LSGRLSLHDLSLTYQTSRGPLEALGPVSFDLEDGEFIAVLGPSGCGKSTLLKLLSGLLPATSGEARLNGEIIDRPRRDVGIVFQKPTLLPWKTVRDNVLVPLRVLGTQTAATERYADDLIAMVGLESFAHYYPHELSGGMQQRVGIARGLVHDPALLLMDEPFAALDALTREQMTLELQSISNTAKKSVVFITHSIAEAAFLADRIIVLSTRPGRIVETVDVPLPRPRDLASMTSPAFIATCDHLRRLFAPPETLARA
jgi:NitT/TauT family transport system ATP-binding protein